MQQTPSRRPGARSRPAGSRSAVMLAALALTSVGTLATLTPASAQVPTGAAVAADAAQVSPGAAQTIVNIGASGAWWVNDLAHFSPAAKAEAARMLFAKSGLDLTSYRYNIGGGGVGVTTPARDPDTFLQPDGSYDFSKDPGGRYFLAAAAKAGIKDLIGFVNSAPASMTTNGLSCSGNLVAGDEGAYADYLAAVVDHFKKHGTRIRYVSPMNEPDATTGCGQETMLVPVAQRGTIVRATGAALADRHTGASVIADETSQLSQWVTNAPKWLNEPGTADHVTALAHHTYDFPSAATMRAADQVRQNLHRPTWATEICCFKTGGGWSQGYDPGMDSALTLSRIVHDDFTITHDSAFQWWTALSPMIGSAFDAAGATNPDGWNDGLLYYDPDYATNGNQSFFVTKRYYALAQYSKYVRPGAVLHDVTGAASGVQVSAYQQGRTWTVVVNNMNTTATPLSLDFADGTSLAATGAVRTSGTQDLAPVASADVAGSTVSAQLPARSITTYTFQQRGR